MHKLIHEHHEAYSVEKGGEACERRDVVSLMVRARAQEGKLSMSDDELVSRHPFFLTWQVANIRIRQVGNTFFLLFAGHGALYFCAWKRGEYAD